MNKQRLLTIAADVRAAKDSEFDMGAWTSGCGTVGCAIGIHCLRHPDAELQLNETRCPVIPGKAYGFDSVAEYTGLTREAAEYLFDASSYKSWLNGKDATREEVASRIEQYVAADGIAAQP